MALLQNVINKGTHVDRPAAGSAGILYFETDTNQLLRDSGSAWESYGASGLLAVHAYTAGTDGRINSTTTSFADVDATNHAITFTAPASGNILVRISGIFSAQNFSNNVFFNLREGSSDITGTSRLHCVPVTVADANLTLAFYVTGISAGSHTYKLGWRTDNAATWVGILSGPTYGPTVYEVWTAP